MNIWGIAIGFIIGWVVTRNVGGAIVGAFVGHFVAAWWRGDRGILHTQEVFFETTFSVMGHVAKADGRVSEQEIRVARAVMQRLRLSPERTDSAIRLFTDGKRADFPLDETMQRFTTVCARSRHLTRLFMEIQLQAALADGELSGVERQMLERLARHVGVSAAELRQLEMFILAAQRRHAGNGYARGSKSHRSSSVSSLDDAYDLLGVSPKAADGEIRKAYRRLMSKHHPDKLAAQGLPDDMRELAEQKTRDIRAAYDQVRTARGMR